MKNNKLLIILFSLFLMIGLVGCGNEDISADTSNYNYTGSSKEEIKQDIENMLSQLTSVVKYEISDDFTTITLYCQSNMASATLDQKKEFLEAVSEYVELTTQESDVSVYVKDYATDLFLYSIEDGNLNI